LARWKGTPMAHEHRIAIVSEGDLVDGLRSAFTDRD
jgi:hypothetical protein